MIVQVSVVRNTHLLRDLTLTNSQLNQSLGLYSISLAEQVCLLTLPEKALLFQSR